MKQYILYFILLPIAFASCSDMDAVIEWETKDIPNKLVVEGEITSDFKHQEIILKLSGDYFLNAPPEMVSGAQVVVTSGDNTYNFSESSTDPGKYYSDIEFAGQVGSEYQLSILLSEPLEGETEFSAETEILPTVRIDSMKADAYLNPWAFDDEDTTLFVFVTLYGLEPGGMDNYYFVKFFRNDTIINDTITRYYYFTDFDYEIDGNDEIYLYTDLEYWDKDTMAVEVYSIDKDYYDFIYSCQLISYPQDPFGFMGPPADAYGNINDGDAFGYFFGSEIARGETVVHKVENSR